MDLPTYTNIWRIEKRLYKLYDFRLPMPLPVGTFGVALGVFAIWVVLLSILNAPFTFGNGWHLVLWVVPPGVITVLATRPVIEGKRLTELLLSQARFLTEARVYTRLAPEYEPAEARVVVRVWHRHPDAGPLPVVGRRRGERADAVREVDEAAVEEVRTVPSPEAAPPLVGVAAPAPVPEHASAPEPATVPEEEPEPVVAEDGPADTETPGTAPDTRGVTRRVLNYFGLALETGVPAPPQDRGDGVAGTDQRPEPEEAREERSGEEWVSRLRAHSGQTPVGLSAKTAYGVGDTGPLSRAEVDEAAGATETVEAVGTSEVTETPERARERRRAEEVMAAPDPEPEPEESDPARRLRGRVQGIRVARELDERRSGQVRGSVPRETPSARPADEPPHPPRRRGRPHAAPWDLDESHRDGDAGARSDDEATDRAGVGDLSDYAERYAAATGRSVAPEVPAAPWLPPASSTPEDGSPPELDHGTGEQEAMPVRPSRDDEDRGPEWNEHMSVLDQHLSKADTPAPPRPTFADALGDGERDPRAADPAQWFDDGRKRHPDQPKVGDRGNPVIPVSELREESAVGGEEPDTAAVRSADTDRADAHARTVTSGTEVHAERPGESVSAEEDATPQAASSGAPGESGEADGTKPPTQLDHGTGELASFAEVRGEPDSGATDRTASRAATGSRTTADAPASPTAEAASGSEDTSDPGRAPTTPAASGASTPTASPKGTESGTTSDGASVPRRTAADLAEAEAAALARRRAAAQRPHTQDPDPAPHERPAPVLDPRANRSLVGVLTEEGAPSPTAPDGADPTAHAAHADHAAPESDRDTPGADGADADGGPAIAVDAPPGVDPHDGVFHRVAQNARRLGHLFGQPVPGEEPEPPRRDEPKPRLELDHGTGEQERLGDTPAGVPAPHPAPTEPEHREGDAGESGGTRGWRRLAKVVTGGAAPVRSDLSASDIARLRTPLPAPRSLVVLGCTGGAGQTVTSLMIGHTLAAHRDDPVVAVDVNPGPNGLSRRVGAQAPETLTALLANADEVDDHERMRGYTSRASTGLEVVQTLDDPYVQTLDDRDYGQLTELLGRFYAVTLLDPAATGVARALPVADGLVLVAPANADAERAVSMTFEWLDGNGYGALRASSVLVVNGVSKRSLADVDAAERVARGRCRAIVRVPWDDHLGSSYTRIDVGALRPATKRAHGALGGVLVNALTRP
ncbi:TcpE family conjugal transfer membrane protein [Nocardiopsis sp. FIRDI 009]|uniref:TcpE family conjugal transfer membrane protein n=1 Tax=Nocardiopsis sp. FIRDI 009 TaxID=714197 RepID=UPI000E232B3C|nr:TcpE family conjugal transfer membrane protein [Nocardiopsis sp. FIRDI 009]